MHYNQWWCVPPLKPPPTLLPTTVTTLQGTGGKVQGLADKETNKLRKWRRMNNFIIIVDNNNNNVTFDKSICKMSKMNVLLTELP